MIALRFNKPQRYSLLTAEIVRHCPKPLEVPDNLDRSCSGRQTQLGQRGVLHLQAPAKRQFDLKTISLKLFRELDLLSQTFLGGFSNIPQPKFH